MSFRATTCFDHRIGLFDHQIVVMITGYALLTIGSGFWAEQVFGALHCFLRLDARRRGLPDTAATSLFERMQREVTRGGRGEMGVGQP
jgi:hypothetical protein